MAAIEVAHTVTGTGPPLYMAHGIGSRKEMWKPIVDAMSDSFTCVVYDQRGHGESKITSVPFGLDDLVDDLEALRHKLGHEAIHLIGHSLGGQIGPRYALRYPDRARSVGLLSTAAGRTEEDSAKLAAVIKRMRDEGIEQVLPTLVNRWFTDEFAAANPAVIDRRIEQVLGTPADIFLCVFDIYGETEMAPWLHEVDAPCLVLTGENDPGCSPRHNRFIDNELPDSELVILDELRHAIIIEAPEQVVIELRRFLAAR